MKKLDAEIVREDKKRERGQIEASCEIGSMQQSIQASEMRQDDLENRVKELKKCPEQITVLHLAASSTNADRLRIDEEAREIR